MQHSAELLACLQGNVPAKLSIFRYTALNFIAVALLFAGRCALAQATGSIQGRVIDSSGAPILGAVVAVQGAEGKSYLTDTDAEGAFHIGPLPPGNYSVKISAIGLADWITSAVTVPAPPGSKPLLAVMQVAPVVTTVTVGLSPKQLAVEQLKRETRQRVLGVVPNYYVAYEPNAAPLSPKQKLDLSLKLLIDPATFAAVGITAGIQQGLNSYYQFGQGSEGLAKRFGAAYGSAATSLLITSVAADSVLHQDPRYFYSGTGTKVQRAWYAVKCAFRAKGDNGKWQPPYADLIGSIAATEISNVYYPGSRTQYTLLGRSLMFHFAGVVGLNLAEELVLEKLTTHRPKPQSAAKVPVLREGTPVTLLAVVGLRGRVPAAGQTVVFVLAEDLTQNGKVLARAGDEASGVVTQASAGKTPGNTGRISLEDMNLKAGNVNIPLRSNQVRGAATPMQYKILPGSDKIEVTLFVAANVEFPKKK